MYYSLHFKVLSIITQKSHDQFQAVQNASHKIQYGPTCNVMNAKVQLTKACHALTIHTHLLLLALFASHSERLAAMRLAPQSRDISWLGRTT